MKTQLDPITVEVIGKAFSSLVEEMGEALVKASYSSNIKERRDCSTAFFDPTGRTIAQAEHIPIHLGSLLGVVQAILERYPREEIGPGDMFIGNDPYTGGGTHLPDIVVAAPVFRDDHLRGFVTNLAHHADFMDRGSAHIFQEGLRIPPLRIFERGELKKDILDLVLCNCQVPDERKGDLRAQFAANHLGIKRFEELCRRYGADLIQAAGEALMDYTERKTRAGIALIPDGRYRFTDQFDDAALPQVLQLQVQIDVQGDHIKLDFAGNPPQGRHGLNMVWSALLATVYYAVKTVVDPTIPNNAGFYRPIEVTAPPGSIVNCRLPAATNFRTQTCQRVVDLIHGALAAAVPQRLTAAHNGANTAVFLAGINPSTNRYYTYLETIGGGFGARAAKDGLDGVQVHITNTSNLPVEALEQEYPLTVNRYELVQNSGGAGRYRGGMGIVKEFVIQEYDCYFEHSGTRIAVAPWGLQGGHAGGRGQVTVSRKGKAAPPSDERLLRPGDSITITSPGAGGYGKPEERDRKLVRADLEDEKISARTAKEIYGLESTEPG